MVLNQEKKVKEAEEEVEIARKDLIKKQHDVEKLKIHRKEWDKEMRALEEFELAKENDELGSAIHSVRKKQRGE